MSGGADRSRVYPLSDVWRLDISGALASNLPDSASGTWEKLTVGSSGARFGQASAVVGTKIVGTGGCNSTQDNQRGACPGTDSYILDARTTREVAPGPCPAPRTGSVMVRNYNAFSPTFSSQVFLLLGTVNSSLWNDGKGLENGEIVCASGIALSSAICLLLYVGYLG
jgi:hypothetical protein